MKTRAARLLNGRIVQGAGVLLTCLFGLAALQGRADVAYFLVAERTPGINDSYVLPLTRPEDIAEARRLLKEVPVEQQPMTVAKVARGSDGINRNYRAPGSPLWSWHVAEFIAFAENVVGTLEGSPSGIEHVVQTGAWDSWIELRGEVVAFMTEAIVAELPPPLQVFAEATGDGLVLTWTDLGSNYVYTVETTTSLVDGDWVAAPGQSWPVATTSWIETNFPSARMRFYRVRAQPKLP